VIPTEPSAKPASTPKTGLVATLRALLHAQGSGALSSSRATGSAAPLTRRPALLFLPALVLVSLALSAAVAPARSAAAEPCANEARRVEQSSTYLPNCRAYEQVTPASNDSSEPVGGAIGGEYTFAPITGAHAAVNGDRIAWTSQYSVPGLINSSTVGLDYLSTRGSEGWSSEETVPPQSPENGLLCALFVGIVGWSSDLTKGIFDNATYNSGCGHPEPALREADGTEIKEPQGVQNLFVRDTKTRSFQLVDVTPNTAAPRFLAGSPELNHVVFADEGLYVWSEGQQPAVRLVTVGPEGKPVQGALPNPSDLADYRHAVSADGSRIFFEAEGNLYVREHGDGPQSAIAAGSTAVDGRQCTEPEKACTIELDASQEGSGSGGGKWLAAGEDGARVYFTDENRLTSASTATAGAPDLYEYNFEAEAGRRLTDLTVDGIEPADVLGVSGAGQDGSDVYFVADGVLPGSGANSEQATAQAGQPNLYSRREGTTAFIATLSAEDSCDWTSNTSPGSGCNPGGGGGQQGLTARVSGNGRYLAFNSVSKLTGYDNAGPLCAPSYDEHGHPDYVPGSCREVFVYEAEDAHLACVSCNPNSAPSDGGATIEMSTFPDNDLETVINGYPQRNVSETGQVFFDTREALLPQQDTNGLRDVYEYEHGALHLISGGTSSARSVFLDATPSGTDVFFASAQPLVKSANGGAYAYYDARVGGGFRAQEESAVAPPCQSLEGCHSPLSEPPAEFAVASATLVAPGNLEAKQPEVKTEKPAKKTAEQKRGAKLAGALKQCGRRYRHSRHKRSVCERRAHKRFSPKTKATRHNGGAK
jgi:hypothetical protein